MGHNERCSTRLIRVREEVCPSINIRHALLLCPPFASIVSTACTRPCRIKGQQGRARGRGSAFSEENARARFSREEYAEKLSSEVEHMGKRETGAGKRTVVAHAR